MKAEYLNPFVESTVNVLKQYLPDLEIDRGELAVIESPTKTLGGTIYIGISGDLEGRILYNMTRKAAVGIAEEMNGEEFMGLNRMVRSTIQELCNIISGQAGQKLEKTADNKSINITPPSMITGENTEISDGLTGELIEVPLETNFGKIVINLALREVN